MTDINAKSTKAEIMEAYMAQKKQLDKLMAAKDDPVAQEKVRKQEATLNSAAEIASAGILNDTIVRQYNDICEAVEIKEAELENLYNIEVELNSLVALINAHKDKAHELDEQYEQSKAEAEKNLLDKKAAIEEEIDALNKEKAETLGTIRKEAADLKAQLKQERQREEEEYTYNRDRTRKIAEDKWADEEAVKRKELETWDNTIKERELSVIAQENHISDLEQKVAEIPSLIESATTDGYEKGKSDAGKSWGFEKRAIEQKNEYEQKALHDKVERLESDLSEAKNTIVTLQNKLDSAYVQMRELATDTVKSNGGVKILDRETSGK
ncbi:hypothetical protein [Enterocloster bolteae]|uniref:hypothetical protein n=1 Tax=Enterocloster bolteae TaxID=208479 RepID=UPI002A801CDE|nr:hypothetical protein [Enterocloster bolteae]